MERKKCQRIAVTIALIGVLFMFGTGIEKAEAFIPDTAINGIISGFYQGLAESSVGLGWYYGDLLYFNDAYVYFDAAKSAAYDAAYYASYSSDYYAYDAYLAAMDAYDYLDTAAYFMYDYWYYGTSGSGDIAVMYGGLAAQSLAYLLLYSAYL